MKPTFLSFTSKIERNRCARARLTHAKFDAFALIHYPIAASGKHIKLLWRLTPAAARRFRPLLMPNYKYNCFISIIAPNNQRKHESA